MGSLQGHNRDPEPVGHQQVQHRQLPLREAEPPAAGGRGLLLRRPRLKHPQDEQRHQGGLP